MATIKPAVPSGGDGPLHLENTPADAARPPFRVRVEQAQTLLREQYPDLFGDHPPPLKIGIHDDLLARHPDIDRPGLKRALALHTGRFSYQKALTKPGAARVDLDGNPAGEVTAEQAEIARQRLAELKAEADKKRKASAKSPEQATQAPTPAPTPPPPPESPPSTVPGRPVLRLKTKATTVVDAAVTRREAHS